MIWLTWRQHRLELLFALAITLAVGALMTEITLQARAAEAARSHTCKIAPGPSCQAVSIDFNERFSGFTILFQAALLAVPALAGVFIGAPLLARELEQCTDRLVWTQGITRHRWLAVKLGLILVVTLAISTGLAIAGGRWAQVGWIWSRWDSFDIQGLAFVSYVMFAIALGVAAGALIRRTVPAMAATLVIFVAVRLGVYLGLRPRFLPPLEWDISKPISGDVWTLGQRVVDLSGHPVPQQRYNQLVANAGILPGSMSDYLRAHGVIVLRLYQPGSRFWLFQSMEAGLFMLLAVMLVGAVVWLTRRA